MTESPPRTVSRFEARLLRILRCIVRQAPVEAVLPLVLDRVNPPPCLSRPAVELVQEYLARGCALFLAQGGWRRERFLRAGKIADGRLWDRSPGQQVPLTFSRHTLDFLLWLTCQNPQQARPGWSPPHGELTAGDGLVHYLAFESLRETEVGPALRVMPAFVRNGLCRLAFADDFASVGGLESPDFSLWTTEPGCVVLESLQHSLAERWRRLERSKQRIGDWSMLRSLGVAQDEVLTDFHAACQKSDRRDLARFVLRVASELITPDVNASFFTGGLQGEGPSRLADRIETQRRAAALVREIDRCAAWERQARTIGYHDDGYSGSQLWKADWEQFGGDQLAGRARTILEQIEPLRYTGERPPTPREET